MDGPPREQPIAVAPFSRAVRDLMCTNDRSVDVKALALGARRELEQDALPDALHTPPREPRVHALPRWVVLGQVAPRRTGPQQPEHGIHHAPVVRRRPCSSTALGRKKSRDRRPLLVAQLETPVHLNYGTHRVEMESVFCTRAMRALGGASKVRPQAAPHEGARGAPT